MLCLQSDHPQQQRRRLNNTTNRIPVSNSNNSSINSSSSNQPVVPKIKSAVCFLCLFDGLRTPSIRRLIRKPRTVCKKPLLTFDPSFYAPSSTEALQDLYKSTISCSCSIFVDPSIQTVLDFLDSKPGAASSASASAAFNNSNQRILIHYFGQGCHAPTSDGSIYFFTDDRSRYKQLKIYNLINKCNSPPCFIFDCPCAAALSTHLKSNKDIFAFFACDTDEGLPLSTDAPMDLFSSCLLSTYDTAIWWHMQRHSTVYDQPRLPNDDNKEFLSGFLKALLDAIAFESQPLAVYQAYTADPTIASLFRGFVLAQRVMLSFNIHSKALPELQQMAYHSFWDVWDIAIDCCITLATESAISMLYNLCIETFETFSSPGIFSIFSFFIQTPSLSEQAANQLLKFFEKNPKMIDSAASSDLPNILINISIPSATTSIIMAKLLTSTHSTNFNLNLNIGFSLSKNVEVIKAGMLFFCCAIIRSYTPTYSRLSQVCFEHTIDSAPMSTFLLGILCERGNKPASIPSYPSKLAQLIKDQREDIRASAIFLLGNMGDPNSLRLLYGLETDPSALVRQQVVFAITKLLKNGKDPKSQDALRVLASDKCEAVSGSVGKARMNVQKNQIKELTESANPLFEYLMKSVQEPGFEARYNTNVFDYEGRPQ